MAEYLSEMWLEELDRAVRGVDAATTALPVVIEQIVTGVPGRGDVRFRLHLGPDGASVAAAEAATPADVRLTTDYASATAIAAGRENAQMALAQGRLRLGGDVDALVRGAAAVAALDEANAALRAGTTYPSP